MTCSAVQKNWGRDGASLHSAVNVDGDLVESCGAGFEGTRWVVHLQRAFTVGGAHNQQVVAGVWGSPIATPKRPRQFCAGIIELCVRPRFAIIKTHFDF